jgi:hypothetical protein
VRCDERVAHMEEMRNIYIYIEFLVGEPEGKRPLEIFRHRGEDDIKMDVEVIGCEVMDWIEMDEDRVQWKPLANTVTILEVS